MIIKHLLRYCIWMLYIYIIVIITVLSSCSSTHTADTQTTLRQNTTDSEYHLLHDDIKYYDSIYIIQTDTLKQIDKTKYIYRYKYKIDTICKIDTLFKTEYKYIETKTNNNKTSMFLYKLVIVEMSLGLLSYVIYRLKKSK